MERTYHLSQKCKGYIKICPLLGPESLLQAEALWKSVTSETKKSHGMLSPVNSTTLGWISTNFCSWILNSPKKPNVITIAVLRLPWDFLCQFICIPVINLYLNWLEWVCFLQEKVPDSWIIISITFCNKQKSLWSHLLFKNLNVCIKLMSTMLLKINIHPIPHLKYLSIYIWFNSILRRANDSKQRVSERTKLEL